MNVSFLKQDYNNGQKILKVVHAFEEYQLKQRIKIRQNTKIEKKIVTNLNDKPKWGYEGLKYKTGHVSYFWQWKSEKNKKNLSFLEQKIEVYRLVLKYYNINSHNHHHVTKNTLNSAKKAYALVFRYFFINEVWICVLMDKMYSHYFFVIICI